MVIADLFTTHCLDVESYTSLHMTELFKATGWRKRRANEIVGKIRNDTLEDVSQEIEKMTVFGKDTISSFTVIIRNMKQCPPCHGNCNQGRNCPVKK